MARATQALREAAKAAEDENVNLCLEVVNRFESPLINTTAQGLDGTGLYAVPAAVYVLNLPKSAELWTDARLNDWRERTAYACGPVGLLDAVETHYESEGVRPMLNVERFQIARA